MDRVWRIARRRLAQAVPVMLIIMIGMFLLLQLAPGDTVDALAAQIGGGDAAFLDRLRRDYGLDQPVWVQLGVYLWKLVQFDFGYSYIYEQPVMEVILDRLATTVLLMSASLCFAFTIGIVLGVTAARRPNGPVDSAISTLGLLFYATPSFWFGLMLIVVFAVKLGWLPVGGIGTIGVPLGGLALAWDLFRHLVMPTLSLSLIFLAIYFRLMRASMLEVSTLDFVRTARAKGAGETRILYRHVLRNALLPVITLLGLQFSTMLGGSVVVETVFSLPGLGRLAYDSVVQRDLNTLLGIIFVASIVVVVVNFAVDLIYSWLDPRIDGR